MLPLVPVDDVRQAIEYINAQYAQFPAPRIASITNKGLITTVFFSLAPTRSSSTPLRRTRRSGEHVRSGPSLVHPTTPAYAARLSLLTHALSGTSSLRRNAERRHSLQRRGPIHERRPAALLGHRRVWMYVAHTKLALAKPHPYIMERLSRRVAKHLH